MSATLSKPVSQPKDAAVARRPTKRAIEHLQAVLELIRDTRPGDFASDLDAIEWMQRQAKEALS